MHYENLLRIHHRKLYQKEQVKYLHINHFGQLFDLESLGSMK